MAGASVLSQPLQLSVERGHCARLRHAVDKLTNWVNFYAGDREL
jgi:hypothetical protein